MHQLNINTKIRGEKKGKGKNEDNSVRWQLELK